MEDRILELKRRVALGDRDALAKLQAALARIGRDAARFLDPPEVPQVENHYDDPVLYARSPRDRTDYLSSDSRDNRRSHRRTRRSVRHALRHRGRGRPRPKVGDG